MMKEKKKKKDLKKTAKLSFFTSNRSVGTHGTEREGCQDVDRIPDHKHAHRAHDTGLSNNESKTQE